jgi:DNA-binding LacI/PurR family transcriptional regulator
MNTRPPSLRNVAELAGVSPATASMALRGLARVPASTREVVERAAAELGYIRDPEIGHVLARSRRKAIIPRETIVFLSEIPIGTKPDARAPWLFDMRRKAAAAAHLLGCELETIVIPLEPAATRELGKKLWMRGIRGIPASIWIGGNFPPSRLEPLSGIRVCTGWNGSFSRIVLNSSSF